MGSFLFASCKKEIVTPPHQLQIAESCILQITNPAGRSYPKDSVIGYDCNGKFCGLMPMSIKNYWIYEDSVFLDGIFVKVQYDTLRYTDTYKSFPDGLIWWESKTEVGLPYRILVNDSSFIKLEERFFTPNILDAKKDFSLFPGDSIRYLTSFTDAAAIGRSLRITTKVVSPAGSFDECIYFEKNARNFRRDQVYFKPGLGVIKYFQEKAPLGSRDVKLQQISTLIKFHIE